MQCPICKKTIPVPQENEPLPPGFPFCSDRCKLVDLNRWLTGRYQIPVEEKRGDEENTEYRDE
ncbi:MAG TPA: DNA gyrase inhibitor YacG [Tepidisphaeraceae bacterium]|jgi:hypothetical protein